jgi:hypothetical protein
MGMPDEGPGALRGLRGAGASRVGLSAAMRARDVSRPSADEVDEAVQTAAERLAHRAAGTAPRSGQAGPGTSGTSPVSS